MSEPSVRVSGIVLASHMFQHVNSDSDVEGLVLGESRFHEQVTISDSQSDHIHIEEIYNIQKYVACHRLNTLYNSSGEVNMEALKELLANDKQESVIGWFRQRRNTEQLMTFREKLVHEKLKSTLSNPHMIFMLLTSSRATPTGSTHRMEYSTFISRSRRFMNIPVLVNNLGVLEQQAYWRISAPCSASGYCLAMKKHGSKFFSPGGQLREVMEIDKMNESLQAELQKACRSLEESEQEAEALQAEVSALRRTLRLRQETSADKSAEADVPPEPRNNQRLLRAIRTLLGEAPLFLTQTLDLEGFPVTDGNGPAEAEQQRLLQESTSSCRKRQREALLGSGRKRRRSKS